jgi:hypothetical protein
MQIVTISSRATGFTIVCNACAREIGQPGWTGATFAGRLDLDLSGGMFLCRRGHDVRVERELPVARSRASEAA